MLVNAIVEEPDAVLQDVEATDGTLQTI